MNGDPPRCPECDSLECVVNNDPGNYSVYTFCFSCGYEGQDFYEDLYGCMAVPWGYLL